MRVEKKINGEKNINLNSFEYIDSLKKSLFVELKDLFTRVSFLNSPPYIVQESKDNLYEVKIVNKFNESSRIYNINDSTYLDYYFSKNTLFFLSDGFAVDFKDLSSEPDLIVFGSLLEEEFYQKASDVIIIDNVNVFDNFYNSYYECEYKLNKNLSEIKIKNFYLNKLLDMSLYNKNGYNSVGFKISDLYLGSNIEQLEFPCSININTLHFKNDKILKYSFEGVYVENLDIPEGVEALYFNKILNVNCSKLILPSTLKYIGEGSFKNSNIKNIDTSKMTNFGLGMLAFSNSSVKKLDLLHCSYIGCSCFSHSNISKLELNLNTKIGASAFSSMEHLISVSYIDLPLNKFNINKYKKYEYDPNYENEIMKKASDKMDYKYDISHFYSEYVNNSYNFPIDLFHNDYFLSKIDIPVNSLILEHGSVKNCKYGLKITGYNEIKVYDIAYTLLATTNVDVFYSVSSYFEKYYYKDYNECLNLVSYICSMAYNMDFEGFYNYKYKDKKYNKLLFKLYDDIYEYNKYYDYNLDLIDENLIGEKDDMQIYAMEELESIHYTIEIVYKELLNSFYEYFDTFDSSSAYMFGYNYNLIGKKDKLVANLDNLIQIVIDDIVVGKVRNNEEIKKYGEDISFRKLHSVDTFSL